MTRVGAITIGQTPRDDIAGELRAVLGGGVRIVQAGALDGLSRAEIEALAPAPGDDGALITHLRDGATVLVAKPRIVPRLRACIDRLADDVDVIVILCAGGFPPFASARPVLVPERCLAAVVDAVFDGRRLGVIVPIKEQQASSARAVVACRSGRRRHRRVAVRRASAPRGGGGRAPARRRDARRDGVSGLHDRDEARRARRDRSARVAADDRAGALSRRVGLTGRPHNPGRPRVQRGSGGRRLTTRPSA